MTRRDLGNRASPVDWAHMKRPLVATQLFSIGNCNCTYAFNRDSGISYISFFLFLIYLLNKPSVYYLTIKHFALNSYLVFNFIDVSCNGSQQLFPVHSESLRKSHNSFLPSVAGMSV